MEYDKQIEIKLEENNCIINVPKDSNSSSYSNSKIIDDNLSLSISVTSEENLNQKNNLNNLNDNQYLYSNEKSKLEITCQSIFYSDLKSENSNMKTPLLFLNNKNNNINNDNINKESIVKKLNFDDNKENNNINNINNNNKDGNNKFNNSEIPNINIRKLPLIKRDNIIKKISKNLNKEYFIYEKIYSSNKSNNNNSNNNKNTQRFILNKKIKDNIIKNSSINTKINHTINKTQIIEDNNSNNNDIYQITENLGSKGNFILPNNKNNNLILNKCPSKPNISNSNIRIKLNTILNSKNNSLKELDIMPKIISKENTNMNNTNNIKAKKLAKNQILYPSLTSGNFNTNSNKATKPLLKSNNLYLLNSFNKSANNNAKIKAFSNNNENSNQNTPLILNKQIILKTPKTNSYSCSTSYSAKTSNKIQNEIYIINSENKTNNKNFMKDPILCRVEAHNSLLRNFLMNKSNIINNNNNLLKENKENININNNKFNYNTNEKNFGENYLENSINKQIKLKKFNTDFKLPINQYKKIGLLTERNLKNINKNINDLRYNNKWFQNSEFDNGI